MYPARQWQWHSSLMTSRGLTIEEGDIESAPHRSVMVIIYGIPVVQNSDLQLITAVNVSASENKYNWNSQQVLLKRSENLRFLCN